MAEKFNPAIAISDKLILFNLHNAGLEKQKKFKPTEITLPDSSNVKRKVVQYEGAGLGTDLINSGCLNGTDMPDKTAFMNKAGVYEVGIVVKIGDETFDTNLYNKPSILKEIEDPIRKSALEPIRYYMKVFAGSDAIQDSDLQIIHFGKIRKDAGKNTNYVLDERIIDGKPEGFGYALCKIRYSVGLGK